MIWFRDVAERAAATWVETFCGLLIASGLDAPGIHLISVAERAAIAALPAALAIIKAAFASRVGPPSSASRPGRRRRPDPVATRSASRRGDDRRRRQPPRDSREEQRRRGRQRPAVRAARFDHSSRCGRDIRR